MTIAPTPPSAVDLAPAVGRLTKDVKEALSTLTPREARYLVDTYYQLQENRKRADNQVRSMSEDGEPHAGIQWVADYARALENRIRTMLDVYSNSQDIGVWSRSVKGIGPVIAAGLMAHIDITRAPTVGHIWRFAGLDPTVRWGKGEKRPWNASLKTLCWKIGESFVKVSGHDDAFYGKIYVERKELEQQRNDSGKFADQAADTLQEKKIGKKTEAFKHYTEGKLPPARIHARAKRYAVKLFLSHWHEMAYRYEYDRDPPNPYPIAMLGHAHKIEPPQAADDE